MIKDVTANSQQESGQQHGSPKARAHQTGPLGHGASARFARDVTYQDLMSLLQESSSIAS